MLSWARHLELGTIEIATLEQHDLSAPAKFLGGRTEHREATTKFVDHVGQRDRGTHACRRGLVAELPGAPLAQVGCPWVDESACNRRLASPSRLRRLAPPGRDAPVCAWVCLAVLSVSRC